MGCQQLRKMDIHIIRLRLKGDWEISNRKSAMDKIQWLVDEGDRKTYSEIVDELKDQEAMEKTDLSSIYPDESERYQADHASGAGEWTSKSKYYPTQ